jgi:hypothetical protein
MEGGPPKPGFGLSGVALLPCRVSPPGAPSFRVFCERVDAADIPPFHKQCNTCFRSRCTVTAHTDVPGHF